MSKIGMIEERQNANGLVLAGSIQTMELSFNFFLEAAAASDNPSAPSHRICAWSKSGEAVPVGSAWTKQITKPGREGETFFTLTFDDPSFDRPLNVAAFKNAQSGNWDVMFRRRQDS
jgi:uncharacterized protein (DUF736 family)